VQAVDREQHGHSDEVKRRAIQFRVAIMPVGVEVVDFQLARPDDAPPSDNQHANLQVSQPVLACLSTQVADEIS
jgi:hypothetical protein